MAGSASLKLKGSQGPHVGNRHSSKNREALRRGSADVTPSGGVAYTGAGDKPGFGRSLVLRGLMSMMCAVMSCPFWAGWLNKSPRTPQLRPFKTTTYTKHFHPQITHTAQIRTPHRFSPAAQTLSFLCNLRNLRISP